MIPFNKEYLNHNLVFHFKYSDICTIFLCKKCNTFINYINVETDIRNSYEKVYLDKNSKWKCIVNDNLISILTCEEIIIKKLLE